MTCLEPLGNNKYKCIKHGLIFTINKWPFRCSLCQQTIQGPEYKEKPTLPSLTQQAINLSKAVAKHTADLLRNVSQEEYIKRLEICNTNKCGNYLEGRCAHPSCGCFLSVKTRWNSEHCPVGFW